jgi:hypothetical protein
MRKTKSNFIESLRSPGNPLHRLFNKRLIYPWAGLLISIAGLIFYAYQGDIIVTIYYAFSAGAFFGFIVLSITVVFRQSEIIEKYRKLYEKDKFLELVTKKTGIKL